MSNEVKKSAVAAQLLGFYGESEASGLTDRWELDILTRFIQTERSSIYSTTVKALIV
jgi:hypothetical protein